MFNFSSFVSRHNGFSASWQAFRAAARFALLRLARQQSRPTSVLLSILLFCLWAPLALAASTYSFRNDVFSYDTPSASATTLAWHASGASPACTTYPDGDDDWADVAFPSGFTFTFAGVVRNSVRVYSNGILAFGTDNSGYWRQFTNLTLPITAAGNAYAGCANTQPSNLMIVYWTDIVAGTANSTSGASVKYELLGTAPNRRLVISWVNVKLWGRTTRYNFQVALYESPAGGLNSNFKYQYTTGSSDGSAATVGVQLNYTNATTNDYQLYSYNQAFIDPTVGSAILWYPANQLGSRAAEYRFDENLWNGTANEVKDSSGNAQDGVRAGSAVSVAGGKICRGGSIPSNTSNAIIDGVSTPITPVSAGSIDFWFKSNVAWNSANAMLFDATTLAARPFFLMKSSTGVLTFSLTDSAGTVRSVSAAAKTFALGTWHHVGVSWNLRPGTNQTYLQIFLDGVQTASLRTTSNGTLTPLSTLFIGDNRSSGVTPNSANGVIDEVNFYPTEINAAQVLADYSDTRTSCSVIDHFHVIHNGSAVTCDVTPVTIEAHDSAHAQISLSGVTLSLTTSNSHGNWSNITGGSVGSITNLGSGSGSYVFSNESSVTFGLSNPTTVAESLTIGATAGAITTTSGAAATCVAQDYTFGTTCNTALSFSLAGFRFVDGSGSAISPQVAGVASGTYYLQAIKQSTTTGACTSLFPAGTSVNIELGSECNNPSTCQSGQAVTFTPGTGAGMAGTIVANANGAITASSAASTYSSMALTFNAVSPLPLPAVPFTFSYSDVGQIRLWARYIPSGSATISGNSQFVVAPKSFAFSAIDAAPIKAGKTFYATITAMNGAATPAATPNFGKESTPETVTLSFVKNEPTGTSSATGSLTSSVGAFGVPVASGGKGPGAALATLAWSEVGKIDLTATLASSSYLGSGLTASGTQTAVGRFIPDHFDVAVTPACLNAIGDFTYSGQPFRVKVTAMNGAASPVVTQNYDGTVNTAPNYAKALTLSDANAAGVGLLAPTAFLASWFNKGVATLNTPAYTFTTPRTVPTTIKPRAVDTDSVTSSGAAEGTALIDSGRVSLLNANGSELLNLPLVLRLQHWASAALGWQTNAADTCTVINPSDFAFDFLGTGNNLAACETWISIGGAAPNYTAALTRPGAGNAGWTDITLNLAAAATGNRCVAVGAAGPAATTANRPWLQFNWKGAVGNPSARATFGVYKSGPIIHRREMY